MKISNKTLDVLKNFSDINQSILIKKGKKLKTVSTMKNILAHAEVEEDFPQDFAIYQLNEFIGNVDAGSELVFYDKYVDAIDADGEPTKLMFADPHVVKDAYPSKDIIMPSKEINFHLSQKTLEKIKKKASSLQLNDILIKGCSKSDKIFLIVINKKNDTSNSFTAEVGEGVSESFKMYFKSENWKMISGDYDVCISKNRISYFKNKKENLEYWIALEPDSNYGE